MEKTIALDISGNWKEGKGTTGIAVMQGRIVVHLDQIHAGDFESPEAYWDAHVTMLQIEYPDEVVMEGYRLYNHKGQQANAQANSELETPQLKGIIRHTCHILEIPLTIQYAAEVKSRWKEDILVKKGILDKKNGRYLFRGESTNQHQRDALKHILHYDRYKRK